jgi:hypothetical protein
MGGRTEKMNIEHRMLKVERRNRHMFLYFYSMLVVRCSMFDVPLFEQAQMA